MDNSRHSSKRKAPSSPTSKKGKRRCTRTRPCDSCRQQLEQEGRVSPDGEVENSHPRGTPAVPPEIAEQLALVSLPSGCFQSRQVPFQGPASNENPQAHIVPLQAANFIWVDHVSVLPGLFGYRNGSKINIPGLLSSVGFNRHSRPNVETLTVPSDSVSGIIWEMKRMPSRPILDFLVQMVLTDLDWMVRLIHAPSFLAYYEFWWTKQLPGGDNDEIYVVDIEFAVLVLRMCSLALQFLPSPSYTLDSVGGVPLAELRTTCNNVARSLGNAAEVLDERGSLFRVQHSSFFGFKLACEGRLDLSWKELCKSVQMAQGLGYFSLGSGQPSQAGQIQIQRQVTRQVICTLYYWDGILSRQLDHPSSFPNGFELNDTALMQPASEVESEMHVPGPFSERMLQTRLVSFWARTEKLRCNNVASYEPIRVQKVHDRFQQEFIEKLPPFFDLETPDCTWDQHVRHLPKQRQLLRATVYNTICHIFRPILLLQATDVPALPEELQVLIASQSNTLAMAALNMLDASSKLQALMGTVYTRLPAVTAFPFESAVILACLCIKDLVPSENTPPGEGSVEERGPYGGTIPGSSTEQGNPDKLVCRERCITAVKETYTRLQVLVNVNVMAESALDSLSDLLSTIQKTKPGAPESSS